MSDGTKPKSKDEGVKDDGKDWKPALAELDHVHSLVRTANSNDPGYARQKAANKLWVRERLDALLDARSFSEVGSVTGTPVYDGDGKLREFRPANAIMGFGRVNGRRVFVTADDFTVRGGHADGGIQMKAPAGEIRLLDGSSGGGSVATYLTMGATYIPLLPGLNQSMYALSTVPVASALLGPVVGLAAAKAAMSHFSVMVKGLSQLFAAGPPVVRQATFEDLSKEDLGGWHVHATNGTVDNVALSEPDAFAQIARFLSFLPQSVFELPPRENDGGTADPVDRREEALVSVIPRRRARTYDVRSIVRMVVDKAQDKEGEEGSTFFEIGATWGRGVVTGLARLGGWSVGVLTSDCTVGGGALDALGSQKVARFVGMCDHFGLPILNLVDQPGFAVGSAAEHTATIRHGASAMAALWNASVPLYTVIMRRAFGVAGGAFADPSDGKNTRVAWCSGDWGSLPLEGGIEAAYKRELDAAPTPQAREVRMQELLDQFEGVRAPLRTARQFGIDEIVDPRDTRRLACEWVEHVYTAVLPSRLAVKQVAYGWTGRTPVGQGYKL
ncbi:propionyl-CoA carboxylase [Coniophora puteana RWD-64-598 SS2]|uniref:Propionyl-CoA carboxylase n=1 Tax=Coniophora puteana (strain RWD-64-598) TaxID=741705 RepID=R7SEN9_CONPW|nr:propionyl-CoA carboxylase [Coniophora puteana RWD-64-598 SS2]EIW74330.1 propionyl-CoA carboxylase [Coniophora puteana RWD-64-598 SS2]